MTGRGERAVRSVYRLALAVAAPLLLAGLVFDSPRALTAGVIVVMATPIVGVMLVAAALAAARDWTFAAVALVVIAILGSSLYAAVHLPPPRRTSSPARP
jgi:uncharacterized membrane protein